MEARSDFQKAKSNGISLKKWRRKRKNSYQVKILTENFDIKSNWTKDQVVFLSEKTGLSEPQVYKWGWDHKKKLRKQAQKFNIKELICSEIMPPSKFDLEMMYLQKAYKEFIFSVNSITPTQLAF
jgi:hypothetical protein